MSETPEPLLTAILEIRDLVRLMAEPQIATRDQRLRDELKRIVGRSAQKGNSVTLMDGSRPQVAICKSTGIKPGNLSTLVKELIQAKLLTGDKKQPKLTISIPKNFFDEMTS